MEKPPRVREIKIYVLLTVAFITILMQQNIRFVEKMKLEMGKSLSSAD